MTDETWSLLTDAAERAPLAAEFFFDAPTENAAQALARELEPGSTQVHVRSDRVGLIRRREVWSVAGFTLIDSPSLEHMKRWVTEMVVAGERHGCTFDGWGAETPADPPR
jgi:hypothetical protein